MRANRTEMLTYDCSMLLIENKHTKSLWKAEAF